MLYESVYVTMIEKKMCGEKKIEVFIARDSCEDIRMTDLDIQEFKEFISIYQY